MSILKDLYYGHIDIIGRNSMDSPEYRRCVENAAECEKESNRQPNPALPSN